VWRFENSVNHISKDGTLTRSAQIETYCKGIEEKAVAISLGVVTVVRVCVNNTPALLSGFDNVSKIGLPISPRVNIGHGINR
jgi:hypothetical protein